MNKVHLIINNLLFNLFFFRTCFKVFKHVAPVYFQNFTLTNICSGANRIILGVEKKQARIKEGKEKKREVGTFSVDRASGNFHFFQCLPPTGGENFGTWDHSCDGTFFFDDSTSSSVLLSQSQTPIDFIVPIRTCIFSIDRYRVIHWLPVPNELWTLRYLVMRSSHVCFASYVIFIQ